MKYLKEEFKNLKPYHSKHISEGIILNANESPLNIPKGILEKFKSVLDDVNFNRYPDTDNLKLKEAIAKSYGIEIDNVCVGVGSDEMLNLIFKAVISKGDKVVVPYPSFTMYKQLGFYAGASVIEVELDNAFNYDIGLFVEKIKKHDPKLIFLCVPNNPTGTSLSNSEIEKVLKEANGLVVVDEAYAEFDDKTALDLIKKYNNLIVLRTFSKAFRLASIRTGYAISTKENIEMLNVVKMPYNLNVLSNEMAILAIKNKALILDNIIEIKKELEETYNILKGLGIEVYPSKANFLWCKLDDRIKKALEENKVYIRSIAFKDQMYSRITIGSSLEMKKFVKVVSKYANC